ncbi:MAG: hypothetical protein V3S01_06815 [Dehalococcoidia bacterium]
MSRVSPKGRSIDLRSSHSSGSGAECYFYRVDDFPGFDGPVGVKVYDTAAIRDVTVEKQKEAAKMGYGPEVLQDKIRARRPWEESGYAYVTELVDRVPNAQQEGTKAMVLEMKHAAMALDMPTGDIKPANIGVLRGKAVIIDFGPMTTEKWHRDAAWEREHGYA